MNAYRKDFDQTRYMSLLIKDDEFLKRYHKIWKKVKNTNNREFDSVSVYNEKYLKAKIKLYNGKINNKIPKEGSHCICSSLTLIDSVFKTGNNCYPQVFLCKYAAKKK